MQENLEFLISLSATKTLDCLIYINDELYDDLIISEGDEDVIINYDFAENNTISIEMANKSDRDVVFDDSGNIISDKILNIDRIMVDKIDITEIVKKESVYEPYQKWYKENYPNDPLIYERMHLNWNGVWKFNFNCPIYIWILERM